MDRSLKLTLALLLTVAITACGSDAPKGGLTVNYTGFDAFSGKKIELRVKDSGGSSRLGTATTTVTANGTFTLQVAGVLEAGKNYRADFYLDTNANNDYTAPVQGPPIQYPDQQWRLPVTGNVAGVQVDFAYNTNWTDISPF